MRKENEDVKQIGKVEAGSGRVVYSATTGFPSGKFEINTKSKRKIERVLPWFEPDRKYPVIAQGGWFTPRPGVFLQVNSKSIRRRTGKSSGSCRRGSEYKLTARGLILAMEIQFPHLALPCSASGAPVGSLA
ncbi:hypothetical protein ElyMa_003333300, partial [Elysia marginata]